MSTEDENDPAATEKVWKACVSHKLRKDQVPKGEKGSWYSLVFGAEDYYDYPFERIFLSEEAAKLDMFCT